MPRGQKRTEKETLIDKIAKVEEKIEKYSDALKAAKDEKKQLEAELTQSEINEVVAIMQENNLTAEQVKELIQSHVPMVTEEE